MEKQTQRITVQVTARKKLTPEIVEFTLTPTADLDLPGFTPGAHITIKTPDGAMRRYSLINDGGAPAEYVVAVKREPNSRGGSASMHDQAVEGTTLTIEPPENEFELVNGDKYLLVAGGIGITPILAMARHLTKLGKPFEVIYCTRTAEDTAYLDEVLAFPKATVHHDQGNIDNLYEFWDHFEKPGDEHVYCCGPGGLMNEIKALTGHWPDGHIHFEDFNPAPVVRKNDVPFKVTLAGTNQTFDIPADRSILEALRDSGIETLSSCETGTCGTCKCRLVSGEVDHRDLVLMDDEKSDFIMICVSRAKQGDLTIEL
ncbi:MAG: PDR/VanB family oxidoreductase [Magnetospiraceae bacterium]